jgi:3-oxoacyl-[acyl-carrier protein] reductase
MVTFDFAGNVAIVTGINREIGASIAVAFANAGARVVGVYYGEYDRVAPIIAATPTIDAIEADLREVAENHRVVAHATATYGGVDVFVANSGVTVFGSIVEMTEAHWHQVFDLNMKGTYFGIQAAVKQMLAQGRGGKVVLSSSVTGVAAMGGASIYGTSKAALRHLAAILGVELGRDGINVNAVAIGATLNDRNLVGDPDYAENWAQLSPVGRVGMPQDVADTVLYLCSPIATMVNGQTITIDGGWTHTSPTHAKALSQ